MISPTFFCFVDISPKLIDGLEIKKMLEYSKKVGYKEEGYWINCTKDNYDIMVSKKFAKNYFKDYSQYMGLELDISASDFENMLFGYWPCSASQLHELREHFTDSFIRSLYWQRPCIDYSSYIGAIFGDIIPDEAYYCASDLGDDIFPEEVTLGDAYYHDFLRDHMREDNYKRYTQKIRDIHHDFDDYFEDFDQLLSILDLVFMSTSE